MKIVAICGPIGTGKSTVCEILKKNNQQVFSLDSLLKKLYNSNEKGFNFVLKKYPQFIIDNKFRADLVRREIINNYSFFLDYQKEIWKILWDEFMIVKKNFKDLVFVEIPFFPTSKWRSIFNKVILIKSLEEKRIKRIVSRDDVSEKMALIFDKIFQKSFLEKDCSIIKNNKSIEYLEKKIIKELKLWKKL